MTVSTEPSSENREDIHLLLLLQSCEAASTRRRTFANVLGHGVSKVCLPSVDQSLTPASQGYDIRCTTRARRRHHRLHRARHETLKSCALTHSAWRFAAQRHLHRTQDYEWEQPELLDPTHYANPSIAALVHSVSLCRPRAPSAEALAWRTLARFTNVIELALADMYWEHCAKEDVERVRAVFGRVTHLTLTRCVWRRTKDCMQFVAAFPQLVALELSDCALCGHDDGDEGVVCSANYDADAPGKELREVSVLSTGHFVGERGGDLLRLVEAWVARVSAVRAKRLSEDGMVNRTETRDMASLRARERVLFQVVRCLA